MMLSRWRRVATGVAAGIIVLCAALIGASFRDDSGGVSVASDLRPTNVIPIAEDPVDDADPGAETDAVDGEDATADGDESTGEDAVADGDEGTGAVTVIEADDLPDADATGVADDTTVDADDTADDDAGDTGTGDSVGDTAAAETADHPPGTVHPAEGAGDTATGEPAGAATDTSGTTDTGSAGGTTVEAPPAATDEALGLGGGVDDAECALDRLVIYAGARRGGVAGSIRNALAAAGFGAGCPAPVTVLASNCPLQFAGVLGAGSGYDPFNSFVASSSNVNRESMTAVMAAVGYSGAEIKILDFSFINPDKPGEQWMAIFIPPSFSGWETLAGRAGLSPTTSSLCASSGELVG